MVLLDRRTVRTFLLGTSVPGGNNCGSPDTKNSGIQRIPAGGGHHFERADQLCEYRAGNGQRLTGYVAKSDTSDLDPDSRDTAFEEIDGAEPGCPGLVMGSH
jgi:hypothetical protein